MGISSPFLPTLMLTDLLTDFCVSTSMTSPPVTGLATGGVDDAGSSVVLLLLAALELELELELVVVVVVLLLLEMLLVAGSVGSSVVGE